MRSVVERHATVHGHEGGLQVGLRGGGVDGVRDVNPATVGARVRRLRQTPVMQRLVGVDEQALFGEREVDRTTLDGVPTIFTARTAQGPDLEVCIGRRAAVNHVGRC